MYHTAELSYTELFKFYATRLCAGQFRSVNTGM